MTDYELTGLFIQLHARRRHAISSTIKDEVLHMGQLPILVSIIQRAGSTQQDIARHLEVTPASMATSCKRMEQAGLIERRVDENNRRCNLLYATEKGKSVAESCKRAFAEVDRRIYGVLSAEERASLIDMLRKIIDVMDEDSAADCPFRFSPMEEKHEE